MKEIEILDSTSSGNNILNALDVVSREAVDRVWVAHYVGYDLVITEDAAFVAYYDSERFLTIACKRFAESFWNRTRLPSRLSWDSHHHINMGIDSEGYIHLCANMHVDPLVYFRSERPFDSSSMQQLNRMIGNRESGVTYPYFFGDREVRLYFSYRQGTCGDGNTFLNSYDVSSQTWSRVSNKAFLKGRPDKKSAYHRAFLDGRNTFHFLWMWRTNRFVSTCHRLCYARTNDMREWQNAHGDEVFPPFLPDDSSVLVDDVPENGGLHNNRFEIIADGEGQPIVIYTKFDENGCSQVYLAKISDGHWMKVQMSDLQEVWEFQGQGDTMKAGVSFQILKLREKSLTILITSTDNQESVVTVDIETLEYRILPATDTDLLGGLICASGVSKAITDQENVFINLTPCRFSARSDERVFALKWLSRGKSHGNKAPESMPNGPLSQLELLEIKNPQLS